MDLLRAPGLRTFLRWRHARTALQMVFVALAAVVVLHGLYGPDLASTNLATLLSWVHYRGLLVIGLLAVGNVFCAGCPFIRVRDWARWLRPPRRSWPPGLRHKWIGVSLLVALLISYEYFGLWSLPAATAWIVLAYFGTALAIDLVFRGAAFCQHVCPIGQFNFVAATASPFEVRALDVGTCGSCRTADCVRGRRDPVEPSTVQQRGCELGLFLPAKVGNIDCTFCLDCVQACPHDNVGVVSRVPALELTSPERRSAVGRLVARTDILVLIVVFVFGALVNAGAMVAPVHALTTSLGQRLNASSPVMLGLLFVFGLVVLPGALLAAAALVTRRLVGGPGLLLTMRRFGVGLVPLGFGIWVAHYSFHFLTAALVVVPVTQSAALDLAGWPVLGMPLWQWTGVPPGAVLALQLGVIVLGAIGSLAVVQTVAQRDYTDTANRAAWPWLVVVALLAALAVWIMVQPMDMRGMGA